MLATNSSRLGPFGKPTSLCGNQLYTKPSKCLPPFAEPGLGQCAKPGSAALRLPLVQPGRLNRGASACCSYALRCNTVLLEIWLARLTLPARGTRMLVIAI